MEPNDDPSRGCTGQPRSFPQNTEINSNIKKTCGDQKQPTLTPITRNTKRGIRNPNTIEIRREKRTNKRRVARRQNRAQGGKDNTTYDDEIPKAKAQEPLKIRMKQRLGKTTKFATLNIRGVKKPGLREEIDMWMAKNEIDILCLQETRNNQNSRETRKNYTWFFSGEGGRKDYTAGVGMVIRNKFMQYIEDIVPINDRLMYLTIRGTIETNIVCTYMPPAERQNLPDILTVEKDNAYEEIQKILDKKKNKGPMFICGDWNARLIYPTTEEEELIFGKHTLHEDATAIDLFTAGMNDNRERIIELAKIYNLVAMNTKFRKRPEKLATYRKIKETEGITNEPISKNTHEQLDYWLVPNRWKNSVINMESDTNANIDSDHYPVVGTFKTKLKGISTLGKQRSRFEKCTEEEQEKMNKALAESNTINIKEWLNTGTDNLPKEKPRDRFRKSKLSIETLRLIGERGKARKERNMEEFAKLSKAYKKSRQEDRKKLVIESISRDLDLRSRWLGIKELKSKYNPTPYHNVTKDGEHIKLHDRAQKAAEYLSREQWGELSQEQKDLKETRKHKYRNNKITNYFSFEKYYTEEIMMDELRDIVKQLKRRKAPGPDEIPTELIKEMNEENLDKILALLNTWWREENIEEEDLKARVVLIFKKGDSNKFENYRPISLLNTLYKIFAAILQRRISSTLDRHLQKTQYGFRKDRSTADAIHLIRRIIEYGESTNNKLHLLLLDWEKAFDKVDRNEMFNAMERMEINPKLIRLVKTIYKDTKFKVEIDGRASDWQTQHTGIRQGCPLSPYLFLIVMTVMFYDVHQETDRCLKENRVPGADFDEVTYADDTICISTDTKALNKFLEAIEWEGFRYGLKLNKKKCELITTHPNADVHFKDKSKVLKVRTATYLGCNIGIKSTNREELSKRFSNTMATMKKLDLFWRHSNCDVAIKVYTADAILRSKLLYGLESAQLIPSVAKKMETLQLKVLRKILRINTTFIDRENNNLSIYQRTNQVMKDENPNRKKKKTVIPFVEAYSKLKLKRACRIISKPDSLIHKITFDGSRLRKWIHNGRRVGRPRMNWAEETVKELWDNIKKEMTGLIRFMAFDDSNDLIMDIIKEYAKKNTKSIPLNHIT